MPLPPLQVQASHYHRPSYLNQERWLSYWYQIEAVKKTDPKTVLEIGVGNGLTRDVLLSLGYEVQTADIDPALQPTVLASVTDIPFPDGSFDTVLCAEVLEHLPFEDSVRAMREIARVASKHVVITLPHSGYTFTSIIKLPLIPWIKLGFKIPHFWKTHEFKGQHYWETGKKGWSLRKISETLAANGLDIQERRIHPDDPSHLVFLCRKKTM